MKFELNSDTVHCLIMCTAAVLVFIAVVAGMTTYECLELERDKTALEQGCIQKVVDDNVLWVKE